MIAEPRSQQEEDEQLAAALEASLGLTDPDAEPATPGAACPPVSVVINVHTVVAPTVLCSVIGPASSSPSACAAESRAATGAAPEPAEEPAGPASGPSVYAVWAAPGSRRCACASTSCRGDVRGIHQSVGPATCWRRLAGLLATGHYNHRGGDRLRGFQSLESARGAYAAEAEQHGAPLPACEHQWP